MGSADEFMAQNSKGLVRKMAEEIRKANQELAHLEPQRKRRCASRERTDDAIVCVNS